MTYFSNDSSKRKSKIIIHSNRQLFKTAITDNCKHLNQIYEKKLNPIASHLYSS